MCDSMNRVKNLGFFMGIDLWVFVNMCVNDQLVEKYGNFFVMLGLMVLV
jgi:hypothetical protein